MRFRGVILDVDGTLVDSNDAHARAWVAAFREQGLDVSFSTVRRLIGKGGDKLLPEASGVEADSRRGRKIEASRRAIFLRSELSHIVAFPGVRELVERLLRQRRRLVVASSSDEKLLEELLSRTGASDLLEERTHSDEVDRSKPDPDVVQQALRKLGLAAEDAVMIGDTPYDIEAASSLGVAAVAFRCGGWDERSLRGALAIYDDPADLLARFDSSPLARR